MASFTIPQRLAGVASVADPWLRALPQLVDELAQRWSLTVAEPYQPGGTCSWTAPADTADGERLVLKVGWNHEESRDEALALEAWNGDGAVRCHRELRLPEATALLLERCVPGEALAEKAEESEQDAVVAGLLTRLWRHEPQPAPGRLEPPSRSAAPEPPRFRPLASMCELWADEFEGRLERSPTPVDPGIARDGIALFRELPVTPPRTALLCTDLHAGNVLSARREPWLAIDPKPYLGDPAYDLLQHLLNCPARLRHDPNAFARRMAALAGLEADRVIAWLFARCAIESAEDPTLLAVARELSRKGLQ